MFEVFECGLLLFHVGCAIDTGDQVVSCRITGGVGTLAGQVTIIVFLQSQSGFGAVGNVPFDSAGIGAGFWQSIQLSANVSFQFAIGNLDANVAQVGLQGHHQVGCQLVTVVIDDVQNLLVIPAGLFQQRAGFIRVVAIRIQPVRFEAAIRDHRIRDDRFAFKKRIHNGFHINRIGDRLAHTLVRELVGPVGIGVGRCHLHGCCQCNPHYFVHPSFPPM